MSCLALFTLGELRVEIDGSPLESFRTNRVPALLTYLSVETALHGPAPQRREKLVTLLWPDYLEKSGRANLRQALYLLRQRIPELNTKGNDGIAPAPFLVTDYQTVQINPAVVIDHDLAEFTALLETVQSHDHPNLISCQACRQDLLKAIDLYQGPFLADFYLPDSAAFEQWALTIRERVERQVLDALETLTLIHLQEGDFRQAEEFARRQLAIDGLRESAYRLLMESLARSGRRAEALSEYDTCRRYLAEELGMGPTATTTTLFEKIQAGDLNLTTGPEHEMHGYEIQEQIAAGGFAIVYRAYQSGIGREVAIKVIRPEYANRSDFIRRFEQESQLVARLEHPHIVPLYDYWRAPEGAYLVMRWFRGGSLAEALKDGPFSLMKTVNLVTQVASALAFAHRQGVVHLDVKPGNILLDEDGNGYLADFGIARVLSDVAEISPAELHSGSAESVSPEQVLSESASPASDQYSLGLVIYEMLTGQHPFPGLPPAAMVYHHVHTPLPRVSDQRSGIPPVLDDVLQQATAKQPDDRFPNVLTLATALHQAVGQVKDSLVRSTPETPLVVDADRPNPYRGLQAFQEADATLFFGRGRLVEKLISRLAPSAEQVSRHLVLPVEPAAGRFLAVVGPSGSGKSSVVKAGLIPALRSGVLPGSDKWFYVSMMPGTHPLEELELALMQIAVNPPPSLLEPLERDERGLLRTLKRVLPAGAEGQRGQLLLLIDQFEELFTLTVDRRVQTHFLDSLLVAINDPQSQLRVVMTLRADYYDRPLLYEPMGKLLQECTELVLPLASDELEAAIYQPAATAGVTVEPGLMATIISDAQEQPGALPLIQYALTELYKRRQAGSMTLAAYRDIGGVTGALGRRAESLFAALDVRGQETARQIFLRLVTLGEGLEDTRRRVPLAELRALNPETGATPALDTVSAIVEAFGKSRLLTFDHDPVTRLPTVEVAHEALLREWPRLCSWLDDYRDDVRLQRQLAVAAVEWEAAKRDEGYLLRGGRLTQFADWAEKSPLALTTNEQSLLTASLTAEEARQAAEHSRQSRELEAARRLAEAEKARATEQAYSARRLRRRAMMLAGLLLVALLLTAAAAVLGRQAQQNAQLAASERDAAVAAQATTQSEAHFRATAEAIARQESALAGARELSMAAVNNLADDPELSMLLALESLDSTYTVDAENALHWATVASRIRLRTGATSEAGDPVPNNAVVFHPQGAMFATAGADGVARIWNAATGKLVLELIGHDDFIQDVAYNPDGSLLATAGNDLTARVWDLDTGQAILVLNHPDGVDDVAFSPDGATLATASYDGGARLWNLATGALEKVLPVDGCLNATFSPDGAKLATTSLDATAHIWDLATGEKQHTLQGHTKWVLAATFSPDGRHLATVGVDTGPLIWDVESGKLLRTPAKSEPAMDVAYSPNGQKIAVAYFDGSADVWDVAALMEDSGAPPDMELTGHEGRVNGLAFGPRSNLLATGGLDGTARVWDLSGPGETLTLVHENITEGAVFSPDGQYLAIGVYDTGDVILWDMTTGAPALTLNQGAGDFWEIAFSPDGQQVAAAFNDGTVAVWDLDEPGEVLFRNRVHYADQALASGATGVAYSPVGHLLASVGENGTAFLWDSLTGARLLAISGHGPSADPGVIEGIFSVAFSVEGEWLATGGADGNIMVWGIDEFYSLGPAEEAMTAGHELFSLTAHEAPIMDVDFSPDGRLVASGDRSGLGIVWDLDAREPFFYIRTAASELTDVDFSPDGRFLALASWDGLVRVWDVANQQEWLTLYRAGSGGVCEVAFSPDGAQLVATGCRDRQARFFVLPLEDLIALAESRLTRGFSDDECRQYLHVESCQVAP